MKAQSRWDIAFRGILVYVSLEKIYPLVLEISYILLRHESRNKEQSFQIRLKKIPMTLVGIEPGQQGQ